jgi:hypothetical protein
MLVATQHSSAPLARPINIAENNSIFECFKLLQQQQQQQQQQRSLKLKIILQSMAP